MCHTIISLHIYSPYFLIGVSKTLKWLSVANNRLRKMDFVATLKNLTGLSFFCNMDI